MALNRYRKGFQDIYDCIFAVVFNTSGMHTADIPVGWLRELIYHRSGRAVPRHHGTPQPIRMKRVFPVIVLLITLSVLGILFIQMQWIRNAMLVKKEQYQTDIDNSLKGIQHSLNEKFLEKEQFPNVLRGQGLPGSNIVRDDFLQKVFTVQNFSREEVSQIISQELKRNNIKQPFEFTITNIFKNEILSSGGFRPDFYPTAHYTRLGMENATFPENLYLHILEPRSFLIRKMGWMIFASIFFTGIIISAFALTVRTLFNQKKLSEIKSDFINNMTHELKTPLATISLAVDALNNNKVIHDTEKIQYYSGMIKEENKRMNKQVEKILQAARLERQEIKLNLQQLNAHDVIRKVTDQLTLQIEEKSGALTLKLNAPKSLVTADDVHFSNIIFNLLDNAIKYSKDNLQITIETSLSGNHLAIKIRDNGIGMNKETQSRIFEKFYRAHTGNLHNVKGFGLGLSYVKAIVDAHHGKVRVESAPGKGSTFTVLMPLA